MRVACIMMQKDENLLLDAWIKYHANLFGLANLSIFDNGSTLHAVRKILNDYEVRGVHVERGYVTAQDFCNKGEIVGARMRQIRDEGRYDFLFPLDCDEFVALRTETSFTTVPDQILGYLRTLLRSPETLRIENEFLNAIDYPGYYRLINCNKTFYAADAFARTDHGFHTPGARGTDRMLDTRIAHVHYHIKPHRRLRADARRKLAGLGVNPADRAGLRSLTHSKHLIPVLLQSESQLRIMREAFPHIFQPELLRRLATLGATDNAMFRPCVSPRATAPPALLPQEFSSSAYLQANPDVAATGMDPLLHYSVFGFAENRQIAP